MKVIFILTLLISGVFSIKAITGDWGSPSLTDNVGVGETFQVSLKSNPTTGYRWEVKSKPLYCDYTNPDAFGEFQEPADGLTGSAGKQIFSFVAKNAGEEHITLVYERPWSKEGSKILDITVKIA